MSIKEYNPSIAIHPGESLQDMLEAIGMTQVDLATRVDLTPITINRIITGKESISPETAVRLSAVFGMSASFWNNLQRNYERTLIKLQFEKRIEKEVQYLKNFQCYTELALLGYVEKTKKPKEKVVNLLNWFQVSSLGLLPEIQAVAFRKSKHNKIDISQESLAAWLRCGEIEAEKIASRQFDREKLIHSLGKLKRLTRESPAIFQQKLIEICASFGVAVVFVPYFKNTHVNGATRWLNSKAVLQLSSRGKCIDRFWFSFFHELKHLLDQKKKQQFIEFNDKNECGTCEEELADKFARDTLIPWREFNIFKNKKNFSDIAIKKFANKMYIGHSIVAGRLSYEKKDWKTWNHLIDKVEFRW